MSTAQPSWPFPYLFFPPSSRAGQPSMVSWSLSLVPTMPTCALSCVETFITREYPIVVCHPQQGLACLCTKDSISGLTLGEGAITCIVSTCMDRDPEEDLKAYKICQNIKGAKPMTHQTLTATQYFPTPTSSVISASRTLNDESTISSISSRPKPTSTISGSTSKMRRTSVSSFSTAPSTASTSRAPNTRSATGRSLTSSTTVASSSVTPVAGPAGKPILTKPQIVGVSVASGVCAVMALCGLLLILFIRRKRSKRRLSGSSFGGDGITGSRPVSADFYAAKNSISDPRYPARGSPKPKGQQSPATLERNNGSHATLCERSLRPEEIGVAVGPEMEEISVLDDTRSVLDEVPQSAASYRTTSRLLPEKPSYSLYPSPLRVKYPKSPESQVGGHTREAAFRSRGLTPLTMPTPRSQNSSDTSQTRLQPGFLPPHPSASDPFLDTRSDPRALMYAKERSQVLRLEMPSNDRSDAKVLNNPQWTQSLGNLRKPVPARHSSSARELSRQKAAYASISPSDYTGRPWFESLGNSQSQPRKPVPVSDGKSVPKRTWTHYSSASDTSFEDAGEEEEIPAVPTSHPFLSPVPESPVRRPVPESPARRPVPESPARRPVPGPVSYPKIPKSGGFSRNERRLYPESPTPKPGRTRQHAPTPPITKNMSRNRLAGKNKPLPNVPGAAGESTDPTGRPRGSSPIRSNQEGADSDVRRTAKWKILVSPGLEGIESVSTPRSLPTAERAPDILTGQSDVRTPVTPTRRY